MGFQNLFNELKRRNVIKVATVYGITAWVLAQVVSLAAGAFAAPPWVMKMVIILLLAGFPLALIFAWAFELTPEGIRKTDHVDKDASQTQQTGQKLNRMIIAALAGLLLVLGVERLWFAGSYVDESHGSGEVNQASIAVLPFRNMSSDKENEYFSEGLSEELLNDLGKVEKVKVAGRTSSFRFKGSDLNLQKIGDQLGVQHILEGSVRKAGNRVRISVQLVNARDGYEVWSGTYQRTLNDIFAIQQEISKTVLSELKIRLIDTDKKQLESIPTHNVESYQTYLKANQIIASRNINDINRAINLYKQAIELDPGFAQAHAKLATAYSLQGFYGNVPMEEIQKKVRAQADRALLLDSNSGEAYAAIGLYYDDREEHQKARDAFLKSLELNPNQPYVHGWLANLYGISLTGLGSPEQIRHLKKMYELDPLAPLSLFNYGQANLFEGHFQQARKAYRENIRLNPDFVPSYTGLAELNRMPPFGRLDSAFAYTHQAFQQDSTYSNAIYEMIDIAVQLDLSSMVDFYYHRLKNQFPNSQGYIMASLVYARFSGDYTLVEEVVLPYLEQYGLPPTYSVDYIFYPLAAYATATDRYERVLDIIQKQAPELFEDEIGTIGQSSYVFANILIGLWRTQNKNAKADRLRDAYCRGVENMKESFVGGLNGGIDLMHKSICLLYQGKYEQAQPYLKEFLFEKNGIWYGWRIFENPAFEKAMQQPAYQEIQGKVNARLARQRDNVIAYLKKESDWKEEYIIQSW